MIKRRTNLCWSGVAFRANKVLQTRIAQENAISTLVPLLVNSAVPEETRVEAAYTLACIVLCHTENLQQLHADDKFSFGVVRRLLCSQSEVCLWRLLFSSQLAPVTAALIGWQKCKGQIPQGPVPRNFLVANVTRKSPTSCGLVTRKSGVSPTCHEEVTS